MAAAQAREACTIPGTSVRTAWLCRDKPSMKEALRAAGIPTAASAAVTSAAEVHAFVADDRLPDHPQAAHRRRRARHHAGRRRRRSSTQALGRFGGQGVESIAVEEFVEGHEGFYDTVSIDGHAALDFVSHYYPNVLEAMRTRWISPQFVSTNRIDSAADYQELRELGARVNEALGIGTSATHMEWFFGPEGPAVLRDRLPAAGRRRVGPLLGGQRHRPLPRVGERDRARPRRRAARRGGSPPGSSRCGPTTTATSPATPASTRPRPASASG